MSSFYIPGYESRSESAAIAYFSYVYSLVNVH